MFGNLCKRNVSHIVTADLIWGVISARSPIIYAAGGIWLRLVTHESLPGGTAVEQALI